MTTHTNQKRASNGSPQKPLAIVGAGQLVATVWETETEEMGCHYHFNICRMSPVTGRVTQRFALKDIENIVRLAQVLVIAVTSDGTLDTELRDDLQCLEACLDDVLPRSDQQRPLHTRPDSAVAHALREVIDYLWDDESRHFATDPSELHIYRSLVLLRAWQEQSGPANGFELSHFNPMGIEDHFGACPICGRNDGYFGIRHDYWSFCHQHRTKWCAGKNLMVTCMSQSSEDWQHSEERLADYLIVEPLRNPLSVAPQSRP